MPNVFDNDLEISAPISVGVGLAKGIDEAGMSRLQRTRREASNHGDSIITRVQYL